MWVDTRQEEKCKWLLNICANAHSKLNLKPLNNILSY